MNHIGVSMEKKTFAEFEKAIKDVEVESDEQTEELAGVFLAGAEAVFAELEQNMFTDKIDGHLWKMVLSEKYEPIRARFLPRLKSGVSSSPSDKK